MNILLTNDDGIDAEGITALYRILSERHSVFMVAPRDEKSACSNAITIKREIPVKKKGEGVYAVDGYTADCVNIGLNGELIPGIDLVISGINHGPNLGEDVYFSGTVAGARSAYIFGVSGIAISVDSLGASDYFDDAAGFLMDFIGDFPLFSHERPLLLNINYPDIPVDEIAGIQYTTLGRREYRDSYRRSGNEEKDFRMMMDGIIESHKIEGSDVTELRNGYISVTPLTLDCTDYTYLDHIRNRAKQWLK
ncbi:MAG: 5'/3'-nucleotidase SurE [Spirochaetota bacterium]